MTATEAYGQPFSLRTETAVRAQLCEGAASREFLAGRGGLAPWQERRAKEILIANLDGRIGLKEVARQCGLSVCHFSRAFARSVGVAPHRWLVHLRIETAKAHLHERRLALAEVAIVCGFADQSHFTRVFRRMAGVSPRVWQQSQPCWDAVV